MKKAAHRWNPLKAALFAASALFIGTAPAQHGDGAEGGHEGEKTEFNAGELIMEHIGDSHDWHIVGHTHVPLPVIVHQAGTGWHFFSSARLHEGAVHEGFALHENHIVAKDEKGEWSRAGILDLSITKNVASMLLAVTFLLLIFTSVARAYARREGEAPKGLQSFMEPIILFVRDDIAKNAIGEKHYRKYLPYLLTLFFFIWVNNLMGLIPVFPFGSNVTGNIAIPLVLAIITFVIVTVKANWHYWRHMLAMPGIPVAVLVILTPIEIIGHFVRPFVLMVRLFANIMAGHIVLLVFFCLIFIFSKNGESLIGGYATAPFALAFTVFVNCLELLVAALQAYVFTLLTSMYIGTAIAGGHDDHH